MIEIMIVYWTLFFNMFKDKFSKYYITIQVLKSVTNTCFPCLYLKPLLLGLGGGRGAQDGARGKWGG